MSATKKFFGIGLHFNTENVGILTVVNEGFDITEHMLKALLIHVSTKLNCQLSLGDNDSDNKDKTKRIITENIVEI